MFYEIWGVMIVARRPLIVSYLFLILLLRFSLSAQETAQVNVPNPPDPPSASVEETEQPVPELLITPQESGNDPDFPELQLTEVPLDAPTSLGGGSFASIRSAQMYRKVIFEGFFGYYGAVLSLYNLHDSKGNTDGNTRESHWNNLYNILFGAQISGNVRKFHYSLFFAMPLSLESDYIQLRNYEFGISPPNPKKKRVKDDLSYRGDFPNKITYLVLGGLQFGFSVVDRKSAKLILGFGAEGLIGQWDITGGNDNVELLAGIHIDSTRNYVSTRKVLSLFAIQILPFVYLQAGAFLSPVVEILGIVGYSPATIWYTEENRFYEVKASQYRRYGYLGQSILGEFQIRLWVGRRFAFKLGVKGRFTFKTSGTMRIYEINESSGEPLDPSNFELKNIAAAMRHVQISAEKKERKEI